MVDVMEFFGEEDSKKREPAEFFAQFVEFSKNLNVKCGNLLVKTCILTFYL
jgi:hypothetical protein